MTRLIGMVGQGVATAKSPEIFNAWFEEHALDVRMIRCEVAPDALSDFVAAFAKDASMAGLVVTMPHKHPVVGLLDGLSPDAKRFGGANAVRKSASGQLEGGMFDGHAFHAAVREAGFQLDGTSVGVMGCGAAGFACAWAALRGGTARLGIEDLDSARAAEIAARLRERFPAAVVEIGGDDHDLWVNASPAGSHRHDATPIAAERLGGARFVVDLAAGDGSSQLIEDACALGLSVVDGRAFAAAQFDPLRRFILGE